MKHPGRWLWLILLVPIAFGLVRLRFDVEIFDLLPNDLEVVQGLKLFQQYFSNSRELIITVRAPSPEQAEQAAKTISERLREHSNLVAAVTWQPPWLEHPGQVGEFLAYLWFNQPPAIMAQLTNRLAPEKLAETIVDTRRQLATTLSPEDIARLSYDPFGLTRLPEDIAGTASAMRQGQEAFSSADGNFRVIYVKAARDLTSYRDCDHWLHAIKLIVAPSENSADNILTGLDKTSFAFTGRPAFVAEIAGGMQHDIKFSVGGTAVIIAVLFWLAHRRFKPLLWLLTLLALVLGSTLALGGLIFASINVVSMGFAAILLGLAVDYAVVHYQEALAQPELSIPEVRQAIAPSIFWAAVTTIAAFLVLNFGGLPGLAQLGTLVALGVALSACIMIFEFLPPLFPDRTGKNRPSAPNESPVPCAPTTSTRKIPFAPIFWFTMLLLVVAIIVLFCRLPAVDPTANSLRPRNSPAYTALDEIKKELNQNREPLWLIVGGQSEIEVANRLAKVQSVLARAVSNKLIADFTLPSALWPQPAFQSANQPAAQQVASERPLLRQTALTNGFTENALALTDQMLDTWFKAGQTTVPFWPSNELCQWIFEKVTARSDANQFALGLLTPTSGSHYSTAQPLERLAADLPRPGIWLSGWELLGSAIFSRVKANMWYVLTPMIGLVLLSLLLAFRRPREVLLSLGVLCLSTLCLLSVMRLAGWSWNLLNLMALPLILGTGVDYSIFMQLALRRHLGDLTMAYRSVGRALLLCGGTACAGFGSLAFSTNAGMGSLGQVCAVGIGCNMLISIFLLPGWWRAAEDRMGICRQASLPRPP